MQQNMTTELIRTPNLDEETPWNIIKSYFEGKHLKQLVRHQLESYNDFVAYQIQKTISNL